MSPSDLTQTRYESAGSLWSLDDPPSFCPNLYSYCIKCITLQVEKNEQITSLNISSGEYVTAIGIGTNAGQVLSTGLTFQDARRLSPIPIPTYPDARDHQWRNGDITLANTNYLGSGFLCGFSGRSGSWIDQLRPNFLSTIKTGIVANMTWDSISFLPEMSSTVQTLYNVETACDSPRAFAGSQAVQVTKSWTTTLTTIYSATWGMKMASKISQSAKAGLKVDDVSCEGETFQCARILKGLWTNCSCPCRILDQLLQI